MPRRTRARSRWRRHRRNRLLAAAALLLVGAALLVNDLRPDPAQSPAATAALAAVAIRSGAVINEQDLTTTDLAADSPLLAVALPPEQVVGRTAVGDLLPGEMVTGTRLIDEETRPGFATMPVSFEDADVAPFLIPGSRIDIVWTPDTFSEQTPRIVAADARVLKVGGGPDATAGPGAGLAVLLEVAEADAVGLAGAMGSGALSVVMR